MSVKDNDIFTSKSPEDLLNKKEYLLKKCDAYKAGDVVALKNYEFLDSEYTTGESKDGFRYMNMADYRWEITEAFGEGPSSHFLCKNERGDIIHVSAEDVVGKIEQMELDNKSNGKEMADEIGR